jgi:G3E family GTPase
MVKVVILTGFLGAGKTTLLQQILTQTQVKCAVIQNELSEGDFQAEMGIESPVLTDATGSVLKDFYELSSGCICCSVKGSFLTTVERILALRQEIQLIVVETTGLADPVPLVTSFWLDGALESSVDLDGVVALVDLSSYLTHSQSSAYRDLFLRQLIVADRILLNKSDLVSAETVAEVHQRVHSINPTAEIHM